ncbi:MAG: succinate dehydrogenase cytochrome b subunit [Balneolaceae bacterium]|nr:succinate dehydrogenase cytochrome b subunit [Balneolaceae bacterium]MBO6546720.1 succinate dehydrogenase cytochrome b subunit [Balneolaceae bacterium]MBO6649078.1 succinate dehydrogenase cytochrome b subunit [Balneolaceae bacterium]
MPSIKQALSSQVGRKIMTGITGIGLMFFLIGHLAGNLSIFGTADAFNIYTKTLMDLGPLLYVIEAGLAFFFLYHTVLGVSIWLGRRKARPEGYNTYKSKGGPSHQNLASRSMIISGSIIFIFLVLHIIHFKFGADYTTMIDGEQARDLRRLVLEEFQKTWVVIGYVFVLLLAVLHLAHGFWSAFTSLGMKHGETSKKIQVTAYAFSIILMLGFIFIPLYIYFTGGEGSLISY